MIHAIDLLRCLDQLRPLVRRFAQEDLGCACPEDIFDQLQAFWGAQKPVHAELALVLGQRLLICIIPADPLNHDPSLVTAVVRSCVALRDQRNLNRCRIVVTGQPSGPLTAQLGAECAGYDEKVHLHFI